MKIIKVTIKGMHCASCGSNVEKAVSKLKGVRSVKVSVLLNKATIEAEDTVTHAQIAGAVASAGYTIAEGT
ncbi:heavy-metal-associated domain-containing protein [Candidatus Pacearchaeota archaeon]|nr:heavy-metal-associated domain-containing protein [Candidatus Pacearchaeota archaeon]